MQFPLLHKWSGANRTDNSFALLVYFLALAAACLVFSLSWQQPILEMHGFRQTQTAISVYWGVKEGWQLAYLTPIVGAPWSVPFEFPIFQWIVSVVWRMTDLSLDSAGRLSSFLFLVAGSGLVLTISRRLGAATAPALITAAAFLLAPVNWFWGRTFMIESCALFFTLAYVLCVIDFSRLDPSVGRVGRLVALSALTAVFATLSALSKTTTFAAPALVACVILGWQGGRKLLFSERAPSSSARILQFALPIGCTLFAIAIAVAWVAFSDSVKMQGPIAAQLSSANLQQWNWGTLEQRLGRPLWSETVWQRALPESVGHVTALVFLGAAIVALRGSLAWGAAIAVATYGLTFLLFPNLHIVHNYYQAANAFLLVIAAGLVLEACRRRGRLIFWALSALLLVNQIVEFRARYEGPTFASAKLRAENNPTASLALAAKQLTSPQEVLMIFGKDWSSEVAYYAQRKSITVPNWKLTYLDALDARVSLSSPHQIGLYVVCGEAMKVEPLVSRVRELAAGPASVHGDCLLTPAR
jgi:hypothetical protein